VSNILLAVLGFDVLTAPPLGAQPVAGPFRPGTEDWMLRGVINDLRSRNVRVLLVQ